MPSVKGDRHWPAYHPAPVQSGPACHLLATAELIRQSIRATDRANREDDLPLASRAHNVVLLGTLRALLEVRR